MSKSERFPSYASCVANALSASRQPLSVDALLAKVASQRPLGKSARSAVYRAINQLFQAVPVAPGRYGWLSHLLANTWYRHTLNNDELRRGFLLLDELEHIAFFPQFFQAYRPDDRVLTVELWGGPTVQAVAAIEHKTWSLRLGSDFVAWIEEQGGQSRDDIIIGVVDSIAGHYTMRLQPSESRDEQAIQHRNIQLALLAEEIVAEDRRTRLAMPTWELAARLIGRGCYSDPTPPDDLHYVLQEYSMLRLTQDMGYTLDLSGLEEDRDFREVAPNHAERLPGVTYSRQPSEENLETDEDWIAAVDALADLVDELDSDSQDYRDFQDEAQADADTCPVYEEYVSNFHAARRPGVPLSHEDYHLLEAELETLISLEYEFGRLLPEQQQRKEELANRLFIDPESLMNADWDYPDYPDYPDDDESPFWKN